MKLRYRAANACSVGKGDACSVLSALRTRFRASDASSFSNSGGDVICVSLVAAAVCALISQPGAATSPSLWAPSAPRWHSARASCTSAATAAGACPSPSCRRVWPRRQRAWRDSSDSVSTHRRETATTTTVRHINTHSHSRLAKATPAVRRRFSSPAHLAPLVPVLVHGCAQRTPMATDHAF